MKACQTLPANGFAAALAKKPKADLASDGPETNAVAKEIRICWLHAKG